MTAKDVRPIPASLQSHVETSLELTGSWIGDGADGSGCETIARFELNKERLIVSRKHLIDAVEKAYEDGVNAGYARALQEMKETLGAIL